ncbi:MCE family protein [Nocardia sp. ET3-3]|uniref:MCE family protein n=1 Tax=Nocardia terrae TaxID=2675851 RepID=A0A7K1V2D9_9NOCA|nr:MCE family protein [Nocardia terrae]
MISRTKISVLAMAGMAAASFFYMDRLGLQTAPLEHVKTASLNVPDTNGLVVGSRVLMRGIPIGHITGVGSSADGVKVSWDYDKSYQIPATSTFRLDNLSALGESYLAILPTTESGPYLGDHAAIEQAQVSVPTSFQELSKRFTLMLRQVDPDRVREIFETMNIALPDDAQVLGNLNHAGELLASAVTNQADNLTKFFNAMQPLLLMSSSVPGDLAGTTPTILPFGTEFGDLFNHFYWGVNFGPLPVGIQDGAGPLLDQLQAFLDKTAKDLNILGVDLLPGVRAGAAAMQTVPIPQLLDSALAATDSGDSVTVHVRTPGR